MSVLTRDEAQTRAQFLDVHRYTIDLDLTTGEETFDSRTVIQFTATAAGDTFVELKPPPCAPSASTDTPSTPPTSSTTASPSPHSPPAPTNCASTPP